MNPRHLRSVPGGQECARPLPAGRTHPTRAADRLLDELAAGVLSHRVAGDGAVTVTFDPGAAPAVRALLVRSATA